mgnify:CR=1 FL=1
MSLRILHIVPSYLPATRYGGPIFSVHGLCKALALEGHEVHVITTNIDGPGNSSVPVGQPIDMEGVTVWYFPCPFLRRIYFSPAMGKHLKKQIKRFDIVHLHSLFLWPVTAGAAAARKLGVPYVISPRGMLVHELIRRKSRLAKSLWIMLSGRPCMEKAAATHFTTQSEKKSAGEFSILFPDPFVIPNGVDPGFFSLSKDVADMAGLPERGSYFLFLGRICWSKGLDRLVAALVQAPRARLVIAGEDEGLWSALQEKAKSNGTLERIRYIGPVQGQHKIALIAGARALVLPSYSESFGMSALEAMACGIPVVVTPETGIADHVRAAGAGIVAEGTAEDFGKALRGLMENPGQCKEMGEKGQQYARDCFSWAAIAKATEKKYTEILNGKARVP